jgi:transcriptional regulator with GAF, ATPase, and Fis domain
MAPQGQDPTHEELTKAADPRDAAGERGFVPAASFRVVVVEGFDVGREVQIDRGEASRILVGKGPTADLKLLDPQVSRRHLALEIERGRLRITDLGSTNGTRLGDSEIVDAYARGGELLRIGSTTLRIDRLAASGSEAVVPRPGLPRRWQGIVGASPAMLRLYPLCERLAASNVPVIIEGETGTGKEALAEALHEAGPRAAAPFVVFDCTTVASNLVESELFGHERGAFTGASAARRGLFELAEGGTLLIDEIGDLDLALQPKLLRAVERSEIRRVGGSRPIKCNVRLLAATRRDLEREVQKGRFRDDLFHRLAVARIELPPLRRRPEDIPLLAHHFWEALGGAPGGPPKALVDAWPDMPWPGNVRELRNAVARRIALGDLDAKPGPLARGHDRAGPEGAFGSGAGTGERREGDDPPLEIASVLAQNLPYPAARRAVLDSFMRQYVARALAAAGGNVAAAAAASGIARRYFQVLRDRREK